MITYDKLKNKANNHEIQVQSAIEDGDGQNITDTYLKQDGYYAALTAGLADNLNTDLTLKDAEPYSFRSAGGSLEIDDQCKQKSIVGGSVVLNQLLPIKNSFTQGGVTFTNNEDGTYTLSGVNNSGSTIYVPLGFMSNVLNHKLLYHLTDVAVRGLLLINASSGAGYTYTDIVFNCQTSGYRIDLCVDTVYDGTSVKISPYCIDLTLMLGPQIADYIYSLEQSHAGDGIAWFRRYFPKEYFPYGTGTLLNVETTGKKIVGFNAFDSSSGTAKLLGGRQYQITGTFSSVSYLDINGEAETITISQDGKFTPKKNGTLTVVGGNGTDTCVHLVWDGERDGDYEKYSSAFYPVDSIELLGIPKLDGYNNLYYDGDVYASDGTVTRKYKTETLTDDYAVGDTIIFADMASDTTDIICSKYGPLSEWGTISGRTIMLGKALSTGDTVLYKLATPVTERAAAFTELQKADNWGSEEWCDSRTVPVPVGCNTEYLPNLKAKIEVMPESPDTDGYYVMKRDNGQNSYSSLNTWLSANSYAKKEEIAVANLGTVTAMAISVGAFYVNTVVVSGGINADDVIFLKASDGKIYHAINGGGTSLTVFSENDLSSLTIQKVWKM